MASLATYANQLSQPDFSCQNRSSTPVPLHQQVFDQAIPWQPQILAASLPPYVSHSDVQILRQQLDNALRKIREYEVAILHQATVSRQSFYSLRTKHGVICPCCKQEITHACSPPTHSLIGPSNLQLPLSYAHLPLPTRHWPTQQQSSSDNSAFASPSTNPFFYPPNSGSQSTISSRTSAMPSYPVPCPPTLRDSSLLGKTESHRTDRDCEMERQKKERDTKQQADWSIEYGDQVTRALNVEVHSWDVGSEVSGLGFSNDGKSVAVAFGRNGATNIYDVQTGEKTHALRDIINGKDTTIHMLCFSPDGLYLATGGSDDLIRIWQISKRHIRNAFKSLYCYISSIDFSLDGRLIALGTDGGSLQIWNWRDGCRKFFTKLESGANVIRFSPDGRYIAAGLSLGDAVILIWNVRTGQLVKKLGGHCSRVESLAFTPDGTSVVTGGFGKNNATIWDVSLLGVEKEDRGMDVQKGSGKDLLNFRGRKSYVSFVAVSSNGRWVFSCSDDEACVWDAHTGELHCELKWRKMGLDYVFAFEPASSCLASSCQGDSQVLFWRFTVHKELVN